MISNSQLNQDKLVLRYLKNKQNGFFVDIGCERPITINNTFLLESEYGWDGISIDIEDKIENNGGTWAELRKTTHIVKDALLIDYKELFTSKGVPKIIDYLSMDLEPPTLTFACLKKIPFEDYTFNFISYETDEYRQGGEKIRDDSREYLQSFGYRLLGNIGKQDDFYIHETLSYLINEIDFSEKF